MHESNFCIYFDAVKNILVRLFCFSLAFAVLFNTLANLTVILNYEVNKSYIVSHFCINKSKPKLHCNGKCYMMRKMKQQEEQEKVPAGNSVMEKVQLQLFAEQFSVFEFISLKKDFQFPVYRSSFIPENYCPFVFHPPTV